MSHKVVAVDYQVSPSLSLHSQCALIFGNSWFICLF